MGLAAMAVRYTSAIYLPVLKTLRFGHLLLVDLDGELARLDFGPVVILNVLRI